MVRRREGDWFELEHAATGEVARVHVAKVAGRGVELAVEDDGRRFEVRRSEQVTPGLPAPTR